MSSDKFGEGDAGAPEPPRNLLLPPSLCDAYLGISGLTTRCCCRMCAGGARALAIPACWSDYAGLRVVSSLRLEGLHIFLAAHLLASGDAEDEDES